MTLNDGVALPKVIDFGIAKATQGRLTDATVFTSLEQFIGTPAYMSPEQAELRDLDIDTRSDIYSLGATLYHAVTGKRPPDAPSRMVKDEIVAVRDAALSSYRAGFLKAIEKAFSVKVETVRTMICRGKYFRK